RARRGESRTSRGRAWLPGVAIDHAEVVLVVRTFQRGHTGGRFLLEQHVGVPDRQAPRIRGGADAVLLRVPGERDGKYVLGTAEPAAGQVRRCRFGFPERVAQAPRPGQLVGRRRKTGIRLVVPLERAPGVDELAAGSLAPYRNPVVATVLAERVVRRDDGV